VQRGYVFASHEVILDAGFEVARARLLHLINWGVLRSASETAFEGGRLALVRVGPFGSAPGMSKLVRVRMLDPVCRGTTMTVSLRWEATGASGELFPVLDADLILTGEDDGRSRLGLVGSYRPPLGRAGAVLDRAVMNRVAAATIRSLLEEAAAAIVPVRARDEVAGRVVAQGRPAGRVGDEPDLLANAP
jgi:hypothetical protein